MANPAKSKYPEYVTVIPQLPYALTAIRSVMVKEWASRLTIFLSLTLALLAMMQ